MAISWSDTGTQTEPQSQSPQAPQTPVGTGGIKWDSAPNSGGIDASMAALSHSQSIIDQRRQAAQQAEQAAQVANAPATIAQETAKGTMGSLFDRGLQAVQSFVKAPQDLMSDKISTETQPNFAGTGQQTLQGELASGVSGPEVTMHAGEGALDLLGLKGAGRVLGEAAPAAMSYLGKTKLGGIVGDYVTKRAEKAAVQASIEAVNPTLSGKSLVNAYKQVATGGRARVTPSIFKEAGLTPDQKTINLATRLKDIPFTKDPGKNLEIIGKTLDETENTLSKALKGDPSLVYNAQREALASKLDSLKPTIPKEFNAIKENKAVYNNVIDFAKQTIGKSQDTIEGLRDARTAFDSQAANEFPNAFRDGRIDTKSPAGRAIKEVRDAINEHLYNTAPNGSEIQNLIGKEADLFRASENVAPKAEAVHGKTSLEQVVHNHPHMARWLGYGLAGIGGDVLLKKTTGVGI